MRKIPLRIIGCPGLVGLWCAVAAFAAESPLPTTPAPAGPATTPSGTLAQLSIPTAKIVPVSGLVFDAERKEIAAKPGEPSVSLTFQVTNIAPDEIVITQLYPSCGCTVAKMPEQPWKLAPGAHGPIEATIDTRGKTGKLTKTISVITSIGMKMLTFTVDIPTPPPPDRTERVRNIQAAFADRQAVFKNHCVRCHVKPGEGKLEKELYVASCGICHDAAERASAVPDLRALKHPTDLDFWRHWIREGKDNTLMPAFARDKGGPLSDEQINSLVEYLAKNFTPTSASAVSAGTK
ncbi:MAG TPA: DUF1573 domain-containing protein [Verrucomicrobiae bacterium]|jgi:mono/diheme cytochrome c family protein